MLYHYGRGGRRFSSVILGHRYTIAAVIENVLHLVGVS